MDKSVPIIRINGQRGLSLVQVMIALFVFALGFLPIIRMMGGSGVATAKSRWMIIATNIARGEIDRLKRAEFDSMVSPSQAEHPSKSCDYIGQWKPVVDEPLLPALDSSILKSTRDGAINGLPPEYAKFEKKVDLVEIDYNSGSETSPGGENGEWPKRLFEFAGPKPCQRVKRCGVR